MHKIFKQYKEKETVLLDKRERHRERHSVAAWWKCIINWTGNSAYLFSRIQVTSVPEKPLGTGIFDTLWLQSLVKYLRAREKTAIGQIHPKCYWIKPGLILTMAAFWLLTAEEHVRYTQLFVMKILAREFSPFYFFPFVHHSQMPVSVSVSITCKHLLIVCEKMLAFGLFPSVIS